jgi:hypothetical protein
MPVLLSQESWDWLAEIAKVDDPTMLQAVRAFIASNFEQAFEAIRSQKVLSRSRSTQVTENCCEELIKWADSVPLAAKDKRKFVRHCRLTIGFQTMMSSVRDRTDSLPIWRLEFFDFAAILIGSLEATNIAFNERLLVQAQASKQADFLELNSTRSWLLRGTLDCAQLVLNEGRKRCSKQSDFEVGNPTAFVQSLELAGETTEIMSAWDHYSFGRINLSVSGVEMKINRPDTNTSVRRGNYRQRMMQLDIAERSSSHQHFSRVSATLKTAISTSDLSAEFTQFIRSTAGMSVLDGLRDITSGQENEILGALEKLVDLDTEVKLGRVRHLYRDLVAVWCYIVRVAVASKIWGELIHALSGQYPKATITVSALKETCIGLRQMGDQVLEKAICHFSSFKEQHHLVDLFLQPLLRLADGEILIPASYILTSRFDRNLISMVAREKNDSLAAKGRKPLRVLKKLFEAGGYRCLEDIDIRNDTGGLLTDLDLFAYRGQDAFCFQSKVLSIPDTPYEHWRVDQTLLSSAAQMDRVLDHTSQVERACRRQDPSFFFAGMRISAYLITDVMVHSGFMLNDYQVVDFDHLQHLLRGAHLSVLDVSRQKVIGVFSEIEGEFPTPGEIRELISALATPRSKRMKGVSLRRIEHGGWSLIRDVKGFD